MTIDERVAALEARVAAIEVRAKRNEKDIEEIERIQRDNKETIDNYDGGTKAVVKTIALCLSISGLLIAAVSQIFD